MSIETTYNDKNTATDETETAEATPEEQKTKYPGVGFTWKRPEMADTYRAKLETWKKENPGNGQQDFILWLMAQADKVEDKTRLAEKAAAIGVDQILAAHKARQQADDRMIKTILDTIESSKAQAEAEVTSEITSLRKSNEYLRGQCEKNEAQIEEIKETNKNLELENAGYTKQIELNKTEIDSLKTSIDTLTKEKTTADQTIKNQEATITETKKALNQTQNECLDLKTKLLDAKKTQNDLETKIGEEKVKFAGLEAHLTNITKQNNAEITKLTEEINRLQTDANTHADTVQNLKSQSASQNASIAATLEAVKEEKNESQKAQNEMITKIDTLMKELTKAKEESAAAKAEATLIKTTLADNQKIIERLTTELTQRQQTIEKLTSELIKRQPKPKEETDKKNLETEADKKSKQEKNQQAEKQ